MKKLNDELQEREIALKREVAYKEFQKLGYEEKLKKLGIVIDEFNFIVKTPLAKNKNAVGINKNHFQQLRDKKKILILAMKNPLNLKTHNFYVFDANNLNDVQFLSGYTDEFQFIHFRLSIKTFLRTIEQFISQFYVKHDDLRTLNEFLSDKNNQLKLGEQK